MCVWIQPYELTLSKSERDAIDWVGGRYAHGFELYCALCCAGWEKDGKFENDYDIEWYQGGDIVFHIAECTAQVISDIGEECEYRWDCFAPELAAKLTEFCDGVV